MVTVVLDDDPTGTQSATGVQVLLRWDVDVLEAALAQGSVYVQTNSRALEESAAVALVTGIRDQTLEAARRLGVGARDVRFVLRGDSTLRGHVVAETDVFAGADDVVLFVPAFPAGGRTTVDGVHLVGDVPAGETEYAADPVFGFRSSRLSDYVREKSSRTPVPVPIDVVRDPARLREAFAAAAPGSVLVPDVHTDDDVDALARVAVEFPVVVRCAAPLAAALAGVRSVGFLDRPLVPGTPRVLVVCGSHTDGARAQLADLARHHPAALVLPTAEALLDPVAAGKALAARARPGFTVLASERDRSGEHNTLAHGEKVMTALTTAVRELLPEFDVVVSKGGITAAEIASTGIGADRAVVEGQVAAGISVWRMTAADGRAVRQVVVPGNVGGPDAISDAVRALGV